MDRLGRYEVSGRLGAGSFATVYRTHDPHLEDEVAVKVLAENHTLNPDMLERFIGEGRALRRARSPHIAAVHDIGSLPQHQPFLVLELADRGTLADRVEALRAQGWTASREDLLAVARSLAAALGALHRAQLVHRDLSPRNLLLTSSPASGAVTARGQLIAADERLLLTDLGMCKDLARSSGLTVAAGTSGFRPPEQERHGRVDARADIWAASALLDWLSEGASLPTAFRRALARGQAENPKRRPADVEAWLSSLEEALADPPEVTGDTDAPVAAPPRPPRRRLRLVLALVLVAVGLAAGLGLGERIWHEPPVAVAGSASLAISGPDELTVGEQATFAADIEGTESWVWELPDGRFVTDAPTVSMTPTSAGTAEIVLRSRSADGTELVTRHQLRVTD